MDKINEKLVLDYLYDINQDFKNIKTNSKGLSPKYILVKNRIIAIDRNEYLTQNTASLKFEAKKYKKEDSFVDDMLEFTKKPLLIDGVELFRFLKDNKKNFTEFEYKDEGILIKTNALVDHLVPYGENELRELKEIYKDVVAIKGYPIMSKKFDKDFLAEFKEEAKTNINTKLMISNGTKKLEILIAPKFIINVKAKTEMSLYVYETDLDNIYKAYIELNTPLYSCRQYFSFLDHL